MTGQLELALFADRPDVDRSPASPKRTSAFPAREGALRCSECGEPLTAPFLASRYCVPCLVELSPGEVTS